ncbi:MAG TPA: hypothetical protein VJX71_02080 [Methylomirabilota bacterium]|nr:hypothetical protein [Methylomirabilota bacterium]
MEPSLTRTIDDLARAGFVEHFAISGDGLCYAVEAPGGARGTLVDAFGVYSDPPMSAFLENVPIRGARRFGGGSDERPGS